MIPVRLGDLPVSSDRHNSRKENKTSKSGVPSRKAELPLSLTDHFRNVIQEQIRIHLGSHPQIRQSTPLTLQIGLEPGPGGCSIRIEPSLDDQIRYALTEIAARSGAFQKGRIYCYFCESASCIHASPPESHHVFAGYQANGIPEWLDFLQFLMDRSYPDPGVLFEEDAELIGYYLPGRDLKQRLMHGFGKTSKAYDILAQITCGYLSLNITGADGAPMDRIALTIQAVESRSRTGQFQLDLNVLGNLPDEHVLDYLAESRYERIYRVILSTRDKLKKMEDTIRGTPVPMQLHVKNDLLRGIPHRMKDIMHAISQFSRRQLRRTQHATDRVHDNRPIPAATMDTRQADPDCYLWDDQHRTMAIIGPKMRVHIFTIDGRLVTSLKLNHDDIRRRIARKRWRPATVAERVAFMNAFGSLHDDKK